MRKLVYARTTSSKTCEAHESSSIIQSFAVVYLADRLTERILGPASDHDLRDLCKVNYVVSLHVWLVTIKTHWQVGSLSEEAIND